MRQALRVLCIDGRPSGEPFQGATGYLAAACAWRATRPTGRVHRRSGRAKRIITGTRPGNYDCVFLCQRRNSLPPARPACWTPTLKHAGSLVFFLGDQVRPTRYNRSLGGSESGSKGPAGDFARPLGAVVEERQSGLNPWATGTR